MGHLLLFGLTLRRPCTNLGGSFSSFIDGVIALAHISSTASPSSSLATSSLRFFCLLGFHAATCFLDATPTLSAPLRYSRLCAWGGGVFSADLPRLLSSPPNPPAKKAEPPRASTVFLPLQVPLQVPGPPFGNVAAGPGNPAARPGVATKAVHFDDGDDPPATERKQNRRRADRILPLELRPQK